jgi:hypothetical protein
MRQEEAERLFRPEPDRQRGHERQATTHTSRDTARASNENVSTHGSALARPNLRARRGNTLRNVLRSEVTKAYSSENGPHLRVSPFRIANVTLQHRHLHISAIGAALDPQKAAGTLSEVSAFGSQSAS